MWSISPVKVLNDNVSWVLASGAKSLVVDPGEARPIIDYLINNNLTCEAILITHLHQDHIGGLQELIDFCQNIKLPIYGPIELKELSVKNFSSPIQNGLVLDNEIIEVKHTPGHCFDHICYVFPESKILLSGDVLFSVGCGRISSGKFKELWESLNWILTLPDDLTVCCGHEYTLKNVEFANYFFPKDLAIKSKLAEVRKIFSENANALAIPTLLGDEKMTNPFLRCEEKVLLEEWRTKVDYPNLAFNRFVQLRKGKDNF